MSALFGRILASLPSRRRLAAVSGHSYRLGGRTIFRQWSGRLLLAAPLAQLFVSPVAGSQFVLLDFNLSVSRFRDVAFIELFDDRPLTRDNFLQYVETGKYDGILMHRLARNFVLQGGGYLPNLQNEPDPVVVSLDPTARVDLDGNPATPNPTVLNEFGNSPFRSNVTGTLAMAKLGGDPNSATSEFFFNLANNAGTSPNGLDFQNGGFTVFAQVVGDGMNLIGAYNNLSLVNLNPDTNDDGIRDGGPFYNSSSDAVPVSQSGSLLILQDAQRVNYWGAGSTTNLPAGGLTISNLDTFIDTGAAFTGTGALTIGPGRTLGVREGITFSHTVINQGTLAPGLRLGSITVQNLQQSSTGILEIQLTGTVPDTGYDRVAVSGSAQLGGTLDVLLGSSFLPNPGHSFTVLTANSISGKFSQLNLPQLPAGGVWDVDISTTAVTLTVANADFNHNGIVDAADYTVWRNTRGTTVTAYSGADANGDTAINQADYQIWKANYGNKNGGIAGTGAGRGVPEPDTWLLAAGGSFALAFLRRRR